MCKECGCGLGGTPQILGGHGNVEPAASAAPAGPAPGPDPGHEHEASPAHEHPPHPHEAGDPHAHPVHTVAVQRSLLEKNQRLAERNRGFFHAKGWLVLNIMSGPGAGKTTLIEQTARGLQGRLRCGVVVGDLATDLDAARLRAAGVPVVQVATGTVCHLDADMVRRAVQQLNTDGLDLLIIENVGNLVCPADFDLGEDLRVVLLSVTEGEDKPLKYPPLFHSAHVALITKCDLAEAAQFNRAVALANLQRVSHHARILEVSARTGAGMSAWLEFLQQEHRRVRNRPL